MTKSPRRISGPIEPWTFQVGITWTEAEGAEYDRILGLLRSGEIKGDPTLIVFSTDGLLQFARADLIPFFYCPTKRVEELLRWWSGEGFSEENLWSSLK